MSQLLSYPSYTCINECAVSLVCVMVSCNNIMHMKYIYIYTMIPKKVNLEKFENRNFGIYFIFRNYVSDFVPFMIISKFYFL